MIIAVPFKMHTAPSGFTAHCVSCLAAPALTASGIAIKMAAGVEVSCDLYFFMDEQGGERKVADEEAVVLQADGSTQFIAVPQARY